ncbi:HxlR family transcriptional regulator [Herbihabitans rhizosphaerae]|uniref:HxlR family transcriptional regulator n=1 Tax=Herbihabitans rhizosphaerae TaxID=1872711 RepID=A0A4Q7L7J7_9PSEU|nr:helix-turn-helix domain-containing protein [Herbihabitans rhizosphaerae]RZS44332.1 HxlR family transcriptional regulator [Herbihabitans rhizosphaerae]
MREGLQASGTASPREGDVFHSECVGRAIMEDISGRWSTLILAALRDRPMRFFELRDKIEGISEKVLSQKLRVLVRDGLVERTVEPSVPPKVSYALTDLGRGLTRPLGQLVRWIAAHAPEVVAARESYDAG